MDDDNQNVLTAAGETDQQGPPAGNDAPAPTATLREDLDREHAERLRLEGENRQLREQISARPPATTPGSKSPEEMSLTDIETALREVEADTTLTEHQRTRLLARLETQRVLVQRAARQQQDDLVGRATAKIREAVQRHPELKDRSSPLMRRVAAEIDALADDFGLSPEDPRTQALAIERALKKEGPDMGRNQDYDRLRRGGGFGGGDLGGDDGRDRGGRPAPKTKGERIFNALLPEFQDFYISLRGSKEAAIKTLEHADEATLRKTGRMT